jgi:hypothetical protein
MSVTYPYLPEAHHPLRNSAGWISAEKHMPEIRRILGDLPCKIFFAIETAPAKKDMEQATDLILSVSSGDIAVRVRSHKHYQAAVAKFGFDWSVRAVSRGYKTEIHKLREGFGRWYFYAYSADDNGKIAAWWVIDLDKVRAENILMCEWPTYPNGDGTYGTYIPIHSLDEHGCIVATNTTGPTPS